MALLNLVYYPDDPLTLEAAPYRTFPSDLPALAKDMLETMHAYDGVGLAGPQVGLSKRIFVYVDPDSGNEYCLVNPEIVERKGREEGEEGCLSIPRVFAMVPRASWIRVCGFDASGNRREFEAEGYVARIIQHETDHLNGVMFVDRLDIFTRHDKLAEWEGVRREIEAARAGAEGHSAHA